MKAQGESHREAGVIELAVAGSKWLLDSGGPSQERSYEMSLSTAYLEKVTGEALICYSSPTD